jgi:hypothetical protein
VTSGHSAAKAACQNGFFGQNADFLDRTGFLDKALALGYMRTYTHIAKTLSVCLLLPGSSAVSHSPANAERLVDAGKQKRGHSAFG